MALESLVKPFKVADEWILRQYSKPVKKWEDKGHSKYSLAFALDAVGLTTMNVAAFFDEYSLAKYAVDGITGLLGGFTTGTSITTTAFAVLEGRHDGIREDGDNLLVENPLAYFYNKLGDFVRMPSLAIGISLAGKGMFEMYDYFYSGNSSLTHGIMDFVIGTNFISSSSSHYVKNSDPKILDRAPFWRGAYDKLVDTVKSLVPSPNPIPQPIARTIENYV